MSAATTTQSQEPDATSRRQVLVTFSGLLLAMLLASLDQTIVSTALPTIVGDLGGIDQLSWVVTAYMLAATVTIPLWGRASDLFGRKRLFQGAIAVFLLGSALSGMAQSLGELIAFRALQGLGAGGLMTLAMAIVADVISPRERGRYQGYIQMVFVFASVAGPLFGGLFADHLTLALGLLREPADRRRRADLIIDHAPADHSDRRPRIDWPAPRSGRRRDHRRPPRDHVGRPPVRLGLGRDRRPRGRRRRAARRVRRPGAPRARADPAAAPVPRAPCSTSSRAMLFLTMCAFFAAVVFTPLYLQVVTGASATASGLLLLPLMLAGAASTAVSGRLMAKTGRYKRFPVAGLALMSVGLFLLSRMDTGTSRATTSLFLVVFGLGFGMVSQVLTVAIQNAVDRRDIGVATGRRTCSARSAARSASRCSARSSPARLDTWLPRDAGSADALQASPETLHTMPAGVRDGIAEAVAHALQSVYMVAAPVALLGLAVVLRLREVPLRGPGGPPPKSDGPPAERSGAPAAGGSHVATAGASR